jgi:hypothetical protein
MFSPLNQGKEHPFSFLERRHVRREPQSQVLRGLPKGVQGTIATTPFHSSTPSTWRQLRKLPMRILLFSR